MSFDIGIELLEKGLITEKIFNHVLGIDEFDYKKYVQPGAVKTLLTWKERLYRVELKDIMICSDISYKWIRKGLHLHTFSVKNSHSKAVIAVILWNADKDWMKEFKIGDWVEIKEATYQYNDYNREWQLTLPTYENQRNIKKYTNKIGMNQK